MATTISAPVVQPRRALYIGLSFVMAAIAVAGFWPTYFGPLVLGTLVQPLLIHLHAIVFTGWLALFLVQVAFAATRHVQWHLMLGKVGVWYGVLLIIVGLTTGIVRAAGHQADGNAERLLYVSLADMVMFGSFFGAAIAYRRKPQLHRRLMVVAATSLLVAAVGRMTFLPAAIPLRLAVWSAPVLLAMAFDFKKTRAVHPVYLVGIVVFALRRLSVPLSQTAAWGSVAHWVFANLT